MQAVNNYQAVSGSEYTAGGKNYQPLNKEGFASILSSLTTAAAQGSSSALNLVSSINAQASKLYAANAQENRNQGRADVSKLDQREDDDDKREDKPEKADAAGREDSAAAAAALLKSGAEASSQAVNSRGQADLLAARNGSAAANEAVLRQQSLLQSREALNAASDFVKQGQGFVSDFQRLNAAQASDVDALAKMVNVEQISLKDISLNQGLKDGAADPAGRAAASELALEDGLAEQLQLKDKLASELAAKGTDSARQTRPGAELEQALKQNSTQTQTPSGAPQALQVLSSAAQKSAVKAADYNVENLRQRQSLTLESRLSTREGAMAALQEGMSAGSSSASAVSSVQQTLTGSGSEGGSAGSQHFGFNLNQSKAAGAAQGQSAQGSFSLYLSEHNTKENAEQIARQVMQMAARNLRQLTIDLNPASLGRMQIAVTMNPSNEALQVSIGAGSAKTRGLISSSLDSLRQILGKSGIAVDDSLELEDEGTFLANREQSLMRSQIFDGQARAGF